MSRPSGYFNGLQSIGVGIVGLGQLTREVHLPLLKGIPGVRVEAIADPDSEAIRRCGSLTGKARKYLSIEELLGDSQVDAVLVASPTGEHARHAELVLGAGKALYLEKPIAASRVDGLRAIEAAGRCKAPAMMGFNYRYHPFVEQAKQEVARKGIGQIKEVWSCFSIAPRRLPEWKLKRSTGGGVLLDLASHHFYLMTYLLDTRVASIEARIWSELSEGDCAEVQLRFENGIRALCFYSFCREERDELEFTGPNRRISIHRYNALQHAWWPPSKFFGFQVERLRSPWKEVSFGRSLTDWFRAIRNGKTAPVTLLDGMRVLEMVLAAEEAGCERGRKNPGSSGCGDSAVFHHHSDT